MNEPIESGLDDELLPEYDPSLFAGAERGKYAEKYRAGVNLVKLDPDVAVAFPDERAVNDALRFVQQIAVDAGRLTGG